ncbi:glycosyltransferase family 2 protein [Demequina sp.]|uniref:glycosyltransferase family 2 protein n=1 Tax=Demequina sp. TaxID=2050685 RepID=UPI003D0EBF42
MTITVIMPARNAERTVETALRSCLRGLGREDRLLVLDDGSTDDTRRRILSVRDSRVRIRTRSASDGIVSALNVLLDDADTTYVARMDADDIALPWRFGYQRKRLVDARAEFTFGNVVHFGRGKLPRPSEPIGLKPAVIAKLLLLSNPVSHPTMFAELRAMRDLAGYRQCAAEDYDLWMRAAAAEFRVERTALAVLLYRHHGKQITANPDWRARVESDPMLADARAELASVAYPRWHSNLARKEDLFRVIRGGAPVADQLALSLLGDELAQNGRLRAFTSRLIMRSAAMSVE